MAQCFLHGNGGSNPLNFKVVGNPQPTNPRENTIWIDTDTKITGYQFSAEYQGKNLLKNTATSQTINGVTFTVNADGSVTANGTASENTWLGIVVYLEPNTTYTVSGCPKDGSYETYCVQLMDTTDWVSVSEYGNGANFTTSGVTRHEFRMRIGANATVSNITFYPMIRLASETDAAWEPYGGAQEGAVWIKTGVFSSGAFNALKKNGIQVYPISAKQYIGGAWVDRTAKIYQGGEWHDWMFDLYVDGSEWETRALKPSSGWPHVYTPTVTKNTDGSTTVSLTVSGEGGGGVWELKNDIDVTNYKSLCIKCKVSLPSRTDAGVCAHLAVMHRSTSYWETDAAAIRTLPSANNITTYELDIASLDGAYDIAVCCRWNGAWLGTGTVAVTVYDIYLI